MVVHDDSDVTDLTTDLDGKKIGVCCGLHLPVLLRARTLDDPGLRRSTSSIDDATVQGYDTDTTALQDLALGDGTRSTRVMTSTHHAQGHRQGNPVKIVGDPIFYEPLAVAFDKSSDLDGTSLAVTRSDRSSRTCTPTGR